MLDPLGLGIGLPQILLVMMVALVVLGPERLPEVARQMAKGVKMLRGYATDVQSQFGGELDDIKAELLGIQRDLSDVQGSLRGGLLDLDQSLRSVQGELQDVSGTVQGTISSSLAAPAQAESQSPPEFKPPTPASMRAAMYQPSLPAPEPAQHPEPRLPDYKPPASR